MLSSYDDFPVHQVAEPVSHPGATDRNFYDRYWFNGCSKDGQLYLGATTGLYPNRQVMDAGFSVMVGKQQWCLHTSRRAPTDRADQTVGPFIVEVVRPMREVRVRVRPNDTGLEADLLFRARTAPHQEPRCTFWEDTRLIMDTCRFAQYGSWEGWAKANGQRIEVKPGEVTGARDRSWGVRPVGEREVGATPQKEPGIYWLWGAFHFDDLCLHFQTCEDHDGRALLNHAALLPAYPSAETVPVGTEPGVQEMAGARCTVSWKKGTRWSQAAKLELTSATGEKQFVSLEPLSRFHMKGIGYQHPQWGLGMWKGEQALFGESWNVDELNPASAENLHVQQICRVRMGDRTGVGALEQVVMGSHKPSGFKAMFDGAA